MSIFILLVPIISLEFVITHDGPAHVYNARLISSLFSGNELISDFIHLKRIPEPNWTGHFILALLQTVFSPNVAERIFLAAYVVLFPICFRKLIKLTAPQNIGIAILVVPFIYSYFFLGGLYNFLVGVALLFYALYYLFPILSKRETGKYYSITLFSILIYFSHLLVFGVFVILIGIAHLFAYSEHRRVKGKIGFLNYTAPLFIFLLPALIFASYYFLNKINLPATASVISLSEMLKSLFFISAIVTLKYSPENIYSMVIFISLILFLIVSLIHTINNRKSENTNPDFFYKKPLYWSVVVILMLFLFFIIPDQAATGGVVKFRFELFFFLFLIILLSNLRNPKWTHVFIPFLVLVWISLKVVYWMPMMKSLNENAKQAMKVNQFLDGNTILLPLNYSTNWMHSNLFNYTGAFKNVLVLDNYEAGTPHFPLEWKKNRNPVGLLGVFNGNPPHCADVNKFEIETNRKIDYVVLWNYNPLDDTCTNQIMHTLKNNYSLSWEDGDNLKLYKRK